MYKRILSFLLILTLFITALPATGFAQPSSSLSGNPCKVIKNNKLEKVVQGDYEGERLTARFDKNTREITMEVTKLNSARAFFAFSNDQSKKTYTVDVNNLNMNSIDAKIIDNKTKEVIVIKKDAKSPVLRGGLVIPILEVLAEAAFYLLTAGLVVYYSQDAYVNFKDCADELVRKNIRQYYMCIVQPGNGVYIGPGIDFGTATNRLQRGLSTFAISKTLAKVAATSAGNGPAIGPEKGKEDDGDQYYHYHVRRFASDDKLRLDGAHSFYPF